MTGELGARSSSCAVGPQASTQGYLDLLSPAQHSYNGHMRSVNIADLKNNLSAYLRLVRNGEEVVIRDRNRAIARIVAIESAGDDEEEERQLVAAGQLKLGKGSIPESFWELPSPRVTGDLAQRVLEDDRDAW